MTEHYTISSLKKELFVKIDEKNDYMKTIEYKKKDILDKNMEIIGLQKTLNFSYEILTIKLSRILILLHVIR